MLDVLIFTAAAFCAAIGWEILLDFYRPFRR